MSVLTKEIKTGLRLGALFGTAFLFVVLTVLTAVVGILTPDPYGTVWLAIAAFLGLIVFLGVAFRLGSTVP